MTFARGTDHSRGNEDQMPRPQPVASNPALLTAKAKANATVGPSVPKFTGAWPLAGGACVVPVGITVLRTELPTLSGVVSRPLLCAMTKGPEQGQPHSVTRSSRTGGARPQARRVLGEPASAPEGAALPRLPGVHGPGIQRRARTGTWSGLPTRVTRKSSVSHCLPRHHGAQSQQEGPPGLGLCGSSPGLSEGPQD